MAVLSNQTTVFPAANLPNPSVVMTSQTIIPAPPMILGFPTTALPPEQAASTPSYYWR